MKTTQNTILITGGGSGIGRGLAEAFHKLGNTVIISGRRQAALDEVTAACPGMKSLQVDLGDAGRIRELAARMAVDFPGLNVVVNNAGIAETEDLVHPPQDLSRVEAIVTTNLLGPLRLTAALLPLLQKQPRSTILMVSSGLAFVPLAASPTYCATKAALHSYSLSLRYQLRQTTTEVIEIIPPYVQTHLGGPQQASDPRAMPLEEFIAETMQILTTQPDAREAVVERCKELRFAAENGKLDATFAGLNRAFSGQP